MEHTPNTQFPIWESLWVLLVRAMVREAVLNGRCSDTRLCTGEVQEHLQLISKQSELKQDTDVSV